MDNAKINIDPVHFQFPTNRKNLFGIAAVAIFAGAGWTIGHEFIEGVALVINRTKWHEYMRIKQLDRFEEKQEKKFRESQLN